MPQSYKKYEITTTFKRKICRNLNKKRDCDRFLYMLPRNAKFPEGFN